jgi:hypothetical protein
MDCLNIVVSFQLLTACYVRGIKVHVAITVHSVLVLQAQKKLKGLPPFIVDQLQTLLFCKRLIR